MSAVAAAPLSVDPPRPRRPRRLAELGLLVPAWAVGAGAYAQVGLAVHGHLPASFTPVVAVGAALVLLAHVVVRVWAPWSDQVMLPVVVALNGLGLSVIYRIDLANAANGVHTRTAVTQMQWTVLGVAAFVVVLVVLRDARRLARYTYTALLVGLVLVLAPLVPHVGVTINGARIWLRAGGLSFQPGEAAKVVLIIFFAGYLASRGDALAVVRTRRFGIGVPRGRDLGPILLAWLVSFGVLVFEKDLGMSLLFFAVFVALLYVATGQPGWVVIGGLLFLLGTALAARLYGHVRIRVEVWLHPFHDPLGSGYQVTQGLYGMAAGGLLGTGLGRGHPQLVPFANSDFIASSIGEELGMAGLVAVLLLYAVLVARGLRAGLASRDTFSRLLATGLAAVLGFQVFIVVGGVTTLIPLTGLTTPFLAAGGSSLVMNWVLVALLLRISDTAARPLPPPPPAAPPLSDGALTQVVRP